MAGESHTARLGLDASGAKRGAAQYSAAIDRIAASTRNLSKVLESSQASMKKSGFSKIARDLAKLNSSKLSPNLAKRVTDLSNAMRMMKGPSAGALKNTSAFMRMLGRTKIKPTLAKNLAGISRAMASYKGPSSGATKNTLAFFSALSKTKISPAIASNFKAISLALSGFRAPSASAVRNIQQLGIALKSIRVPRGLSTISSALGRVSPTFRQAASSSQNFSGSLRSIPWRRASTGAKSLTGNMRGLENSFSASYQAGSQLRVLFGALTVGGFTNSVYEATLAAERFNTTLGVTSASVEESASIIEDVRGTARNFGIDLRVAYEEFGKFSTAARLSGASVEEVQFIFENMSGAMRVMGLGADRQRLVFLALTQMFSKGRISAEELRRQLGEQIPGAFELMQQAIRKHTGDASLNLDDMLKQGRISSDAVVLLAETIGEKFGPQFTEAMNRADTAIGNMKNSWFDFLNLIGKSGAFDAMGDFARKVDEVMRTANFRELAVSIGEGLTSAIGAAGDAAVFLLTNIRGIIQVAKPILAFFAAKQFIGFISGATTAVAKMVGLTGAISAAGSGIARLIPAAGKAGAALMLLGGPVVAALAIGAGALALYWNETVKIGETTTTVGEIAQAVWSDVVTFVQGAATHAAEAAKTMIISFQAWSQSSSEGIRTNSQEMLVWGNGIIAMVHMVGRSITLVIGSAISSIVNSVFTLTEALGKLASLDFSGAGQTLQQGLADAFHGAASFLDEADKIMDDAVNKDYLGDPFSALTQGVTDYTAHIEESILKSRELAEVARNTITPTEEFTGGTRPERELNVLRTDDDGADSLNAMGQSAKSTADAIKAFEAQQVSLNARLSAGNITLAQYTDALNFHKEKLEEVVDPYAAMIRAMQEEINLQRLGSSERAGLSAFLEKKNQLLEQGVILTQQQTEELKNLIAMQQQMENSPFKSWVDGIDEFGVAAEKVGVKAMDSLTDSLADLIVDGKADWGSMFKAIMKDLVKLALNQVWKSLFSDNQPQINIAAPMTGAAGGALDLTGTSNPSVMANAVAQGINMAGGLLGNDIGGGAGPFSQIEDFLAGGAQNSSSIGTFPQFEEIQTLLGKQAGDASNMTPAGDNRPSFLFLQDMMAKSGASNSSNMSPAGDNNSSFLFLQDMMSRGDFAGGEDQFALPTGITTALEGAVTGITQEVNQIGSQLSTLGDSFQVLEGLRGGGDSTQVLDDLSGQINSIGASNDMRSSQLQNLFSGSNSAPMPVTMPNSIFESRNAIRQLATSGQTLNISNRDADLMSRVLATEWDQRGGGDPRQAAGILDTIMNRSATAGNEYGQAGGIEGVLNKRWQFSGINSPLEGASGTAANAPFNQDAFDFTNQYLSNREGGQASIVGSNTHYLNPNYSSQNSLDRWGSDVVGQARQSGQVFGQSSDTSHFHGTAEGASTPGNFGVDFAGQPNAVQQGLGVDPLATGGLGGMGLPGGMGLQNAGGMGTGMDGAGGDMSGLGDSFTQEMETAFNQTSQAFPEAMEPGMDQAAQLLPQKLTEDEGLADGMTSAMQPATQQSAQDFSQQYMQANSQIAQDFAQKMQSSGGGIGGGGGGGLGGLGSIIGLIGGMFKTGGIVGSGGRPSGMISAGSLKGARSMKFGGIVGDPDAEPIIAHKGELVTPANKVARMRRMGSKATMVENQSVNAHSARMSRSGAGGFDESGTPLGFSGAQHSTSNSTINMTVVTPDADSFQASKGQIEAQMGHAQAKSSRRNG